ncbi:cardiolipin synthase [Sphingomonas sp.]|uniref:cardiolipin synthase n=1 Tax=Sphingomonas sp. TaxID=28214 RepID=UPI001ECE4040|nr:cardiolipin synthase [Sphingomonas sp.]MBX3593266.1 cardiolipin synthase [Sphingomonas sp.]
MLLIGVHTLLVLLFGAHVMLRRNREPESRLAWLVVLIALPYVGALGYLLLGTTNIGRTRVDRLHDTGALLPAPAAVAGAPDQADAGGPYAPLFRVGQSISGYRAVGGNRCELMPGSDEMIARLVADIDGASDSVHLLFYIWLDDRNGGLVADALARAAGRGVTCRALVDDIGSRAFIRGPRWAALAAAGVLLRRALPVGNPLIRMVNGRIDLRNHRKVVVIDNRVTYCGSQNCADPAFLPKRNFAPWVDAVMRFEGPVVRQNQHLFATDWMGNGGDDIAPLLAQPMPPARPGFTAQVVATGPTYRNAAMPEMFATLMFAARRELIVTTPYYVPTPAVQAALCAAANRGVATTIVFPARNDDFAVGAASRSHYQRLLEAGVRIFEYRRGLLHTKSLTLDGEVTLIGSANMDRRSFDLNYENNILFHDSRATAAMRARQIAYLDDSREITGDQVAAWGVGRRLWNNALAIVGPLL